MFWIDSPTSYLIQTCYSVVVTLTMLLLWRSNRGEKELLTWTLGGLANTLFSLLVTYRDRLPLLFSVPVLNSLSFGFVAALWFGLRQSHGKTLPWRGSAAGLAVALAALLAATLDDLLRVRLLVATMTMLLLCAAMAWEVRSTRRLLKSPGHTLSALVLSLLMAVFIVRFAMIVAVPADFDLRANASQHALQFAANLLFFALVLGGLLISNEKLLSRIASLAERDALTGLYNRRALLGLAERQVGQQALLAVLMIDLDHFKTINDRYGHAGGDAALRQFAERLSQCCRRGDLIGRYGGEEFCVVLPGTSVSEAQRVAERLRTAVAAEPVAFGEHRIALTVSIGLACLRPDLDRLEPLLAAADAALYQAKRGGRNRVELAGQRVGVAPREMASV
ncbi:GGDEF domain-containing protein [Crenobacter sp. SG2305]|uniref:GGDEF domain-containing protein n=1 Tax=Crenobacter oryzisoli TaxID=3056844 RepID=UPI0025AADE73|nr:GGDEF domain-containing protein [Crenobacter sp. SG2305]MDN0081276.1 GGDEF domain-containing protein [Crenobacter sp. SG2305]